MTELAKPAAGGLTVKLVSEMTGYQPAEIALVSRTVAVGANLQELAVFLHSCRALGLDPLLRQCYWIKRQGRGTLQVGIDGFRAIAENSGAYAGAESIEFRGQIEWTYKKQTLVVPELARATVWKLVGGHKSAFVGEAYWSEFVPKGDDESFMWARMPRHMLGKCAEAQALRRAFPAQLGSMTLAEDADTDAQLQVAEDDQAAEAKRQRNSRRYEEIFTPDDERPAKTLPAPEAEVEIPQEDLDDDEQ